MTRREREHSPLRKIERRAPSSTEDDAIRSGNGHGNRFTRILQRRLNRRGLLRSGAAIGALVVSSQLPGDPAFDMMEPRFESAQTQPETPLFADGINFKPIPPQPSSNQEVVVARGHRHEPLLRWGDPISSGAPAWNPKNQTAAAQERQFGYNCDFIGWVPIPFGSQSFEQGLLWVNHEYTNPELMFADYDNTDPTEEQVNIEIAAHGGSVAELRRGRDGRVNVNVSSKYNRRISGFTPIRISGPAAGHELMTTSADPPGTAVQGMLNNCAGGITPWGTVLTCEENFQQYFGNSGALTVDDPRHDIHARYGIPDGESYRKWERYHPRFSVHTEPNEPFRFGWVVEVDPYDPASVPVKRTALGRFRHEGATFGYSPSGRVAFYSGDDAPFEYIYKYVSDEIRDPSIRGLDHSYLDEGTLHVARFNEDGSGEWLPLIHGSEPLTESNGFASQGDVVIKTRMAADLVGATKMDRPEDVQQNPTNKRIYAALTSNTEREESDVANPRAPNVFGHIIEITEEDDDAAATAFTWDIFILCGDPEDESTYFAGFPKSEVSPISTPDNLNFDLNGNLWISTDGQPGIFGFADALHVVPTEGPERGRLAQFLSVVAGSECASFDFSGDNRNLFVSVQHPGEGGSYADPITRWPDNGPVARPTVIQVWAEDGGRVGDGIGDGASANSQNPSRNAKGR